VAVSPLDAIQPLIGQTPLLEIHYRFDGHPPHHAPRL
jgi:hypothetical protein